MKKLLVGLVAGGLVVVNLQAEEVKSYDFPLTDVVLYSTGVGAYTHSGVVSGKGVITLSLSEEQLNDTLKSLLLMANKELTISGISYPSKTTLHELLKESRVDMLNTDMLNLLNQLKGVEFQVDMSEERSFKGIFVGSSTVILNDEEQQLMLDFFSNGTLRRVDSAEVQSVVPTDSKIVADIKNSLNTIAQYAGQGAKDISINVDSSSPVEVDLNYVIESPVWKASYRIALGDDDQAKLQVWALVENPTLASWNGVNLSLVSGKPSSFVQDLYSTVYLKRPVVKGDYKNVKPMMYESVMKESMDFAMAESAPASRAQYRMANKSMVSSVSSMGQAMGSYSRYELKEPVTLRSRESAMYELALANVEVEEVSIYSAYSDSPNPLSGLSFTNSTGLILPQGPVTVYGNENYYGDASMPNVAPNRKQLLSYGVDLDVQVNTSPEVQSQGICRIAKIDKGWLHVEQVITDYTIYDLDNSSSEAKVVIIEHPHHGLKLAQNMVEPMEKTDNFYRFKCVVPAHGALEFQVDLERVVRDDYSLASIDNWLNISISGNALPQEVKEFLGKVGQQQQEINQIKVRISDIERAQNELESSYNRANSSLKYAKDNHQFNDNLVARLTELNKQLEQIFYQHEALVKELREKEQSLNHLISSTTI